MVLHETSYVPMQEVSLEVPLKVDGGASSAAYVIMPTRYAPNQPAKFTLSVTSSSVFQFAAIKQ